MKRTLTLLVLTGVIPLSANALEAAAVGSQATQATVGVLNSKVDVTNAIINNMLACNAVHKFYAPGDPKKDASGCVGVGDYTLTMADQTNFYGTNGQLNWINNNLTNTYAGYVSNNAANGSGLNVSANGAGNGVYGFSPAGLGVVGQSTDGEAVYGISSNGMGVNGAGATVGVQGTSTNGYGVYGGSTNSLGVLGQSNNGYGVEGAGPNAWGGVFTGKNAVYGYASNGWSAQFGGASNTGSVLISNDNNTAQLCINGTDAAHCMNSVPAAASYRYGGDFTYVNSSCSNVNTYTHACSCPTGFTGHHIFDASPYGQANIYSLYTCYN